MNGLLGEGEFSNPINLHRKAHALLSPFVRCISHFGLYDFRLSSCATLQNATTIHNAKSVLLKKVFAEPLFIHPARCDILNSANQLLE